MSRVNPGWPLYSTLGGGVPVGHDFAADPTTAAVPGLVLYNFIAADRGKKGTGGLFLQRWFESDKENGFPYLPSRDTTLITKGTSCPQCSGRFIDKPHMIATLAAPGSGRAPVNVSGTLEDGTSKSVMVPAGELHVVYSVFTGSKQDWIKDTAFALNRLGYYLECGFENHRERRNQSKRPPGGQWQQPAGGVAPVR